jgi:hypothetical protein
MPCATGALLLQMDLDAEATTELLHWLLYESPPAQRASLLTRLGRLPPRPLGTVLFSALLAEGRPEDALRLLRHAVNLPVEELAGLTQEHLVERQVGLHNLQGKLPGGT